MCELIKFDTRNGWIYEGCSRCGIKPKNDNGKSYCVNRNCKGKHMTVVSKLRLNYTVEDDTGKISVVFFDRLASQLLGKTVAEMKRVLIEENRLFDCLDEVDECIGSKLLLKLKLNNYNKQHPHSSIPIFSFTTCADLLQQSNLGEPNSLANGVNIDASLPLTRNNYPHEHDKDKTDSGPLTLSQDISDDTIEFVPPSTIITSDDLTASSLDEIPISGFISSRRSKGKRKVSSHQKISAQICVPLSNLSPSKPTGSGMKTIGKGNL